METCKTMAVPAAIERSRSGKGAHIWIFFTEPIPAVETRKLGNFLLTKTIEGRPEIGLDSYDRLFPSQNKLPKNGFGNLIALPLQNKPRKKGNSVFVDETYIPYPDQWAYLSSIKLMSRSDVDELLQDTADYIGAYRRGCLNICFGKIFNFILDHSFTSTCGWSL